MGLRGITILKFLFGFFLGFALNPRIEKIFDKNEKLPHCKHTAENAVWTPNITIAQKVIYFCILSAADKMLQGRIKRKRIFVAILSSKSYLRTRGDAIRSTWLKEIPTALADVVFFAEKSDGFHTIQVNYSIMT